MKDANLAEAITAARNTFARWGNGDASEGDLAGALHFVIEMWDEANEETEAES